MTTSNAASGLTGLIDDAIGDETDSDMVKGAALFLGCHVVLSLLLMLPEVAEVLRMEGLHRQASLLSEMAHTLSRAHGFLFLIVGAPVGFALVWSYGGVCFLAGRIVGGSGAWTPVLRASVLLWIPALVFFVPAWLVNRLAGGGWLTQPDGIWGLLTTALDILGILAWFPAIALHALALARAHAVGFARGVVATVLAGFAWMIAWCGSLTVVILALV